MGLVFCAILPHGPDLVKDTALMAETRAAMVEAGRRFAAARVDTLILLDPEFIHARQRGKGRPNESHAFMVGESALSIGMAAYAGGSMDSFMERYICDLPLAQAILGTGRDAALPVTSDGGENGELRLYYGTLVPLWFTLRPLPSPRPGLVVIAPSPTVPRETLLSFGGLLAEVAMNSGKRVALIASADQAHTHDPNSKRFGFSPAAAQHDALYCEAASKNRLERLLEISDKMLEDSYADSFWQTLILAGALKSVPMEVDFLSYAVPTYYGMTVAVYEPGAAAKI